MNADQWARVKDIFHAAIEQTPGSRAAFVIEACRGDAELRAEVERLVAAHDQAGSFIEQSPVAGGPSSQTGLSGRVIGSRARNRRGAEPLHYAADTNRWDPTAQAETIEYLISIGADPNALDGSGVAPLQPSRPHAIVAGRQGTARRRCEPDAAK